MNVQLSPNTRVIDLLAFAKSQGKTLVWKSEGFNYQPHLENTPNDHSPSVTRLRARLRVVDSQKTRG
jgi:predicted homoserine dehydrogenase-like protein